MMPASVERSSTVRVRQAPLIARSTWQVWLLCWAVYALVGIIGVRMFDLTTPATTSQIGDVAAMLWSRAPHYGTLVTTWPLLPILLELIPVWIIMPLTGNPLYAASVVAAAAAAFNVVLLYRLLLLVGVARRTVWLSIALWVFNPALLLFAASGSSMSLLISGLLLTIYGLARWWHSGGPNFIGLSGLGAAVAMLCSYGSLALSVLVGGVFLYGFRRRQMERPMAWLTLFIMPSLFTLLFWMAFNLITMRHPLAFLAAGRNVLLWGMLFGSHVAGGLVLAMLVGFVLLIALAPHDLLAHQITRGLPVLLIVGGLATAGALWVGSRPDASGQGVGPSGILFDRSEERAVGAYLRDHLPTDALILLDGDDIYPIILAAGHPERFVIQSDRDYRTLVASAAERVQFILLPRTTSAQPSVIARSYPMLYADRWLNGRLQQDFGGRMGWRLFKVTEVAP